MILAHGGREPLDLRDCVRLDRDAGVCFRTRLFCRFGIIPLAALLVSCTTSSSARKVVPLERYQRFYVEQRLNENHHLDDVFASELRRHGREVSSGPMTMMPENSEVVLTYDARWEWDFKTYLIELNFELHSVHPRKKIADAHYHQPTIRTKSAEEIIRELLGQLIREP